jgi:rRNA maturation endonuclease Nob1
MCPEEERRESYHDNFIATMHHLDPDKLAAVRRVISGMTRCPECDALNRADTKFCVKCGAKLYPELDYEREKPKEER